MNTKKTLGMKDREFSNLDSIGGIVNDTSPQLGGDLDWRMDCLEGDDLDGTADYMEELWEDIPRPKDLFNTLLVIAMTLISTGIIITLVSILI